MKNAPVSTLVIGEGWSALSCVGFLALQNPSERIHWMPSKGSRLLSPLPTLEAGPAVALWRELFARAGIESGGFYTEDGLREFRGKAFRPADWARAEAVSARAETRAESLWEPETVLPAQVEARFAQSFAELEQQLRAAILALPNVTREEGLEVTGFALDGARTRAVCLNGESREAARIVYADRWSLLPGMSGVPKPFPLLHRRELAGAIQATFTHKRAIAPQAMDGFFVALHKDAGETFQRHAWGHFIDGGRKSLWTVLLESEINEDNHEIGKKYRRLKQALERMFVGEPWLEAGEKDFLSTIESEQVHFEERFFFADAADEKNRIREAKHLKELPGVVFLTDGFGPSLAIEAVGAWLKAECGLAEALAAPVELPEVTSPAPAPLLNEDSAQV